LDEVRFGMVAMQEL